MTHRVHFGFKSEPFTNEIQTKDLLKLPNMVGVKERFDYCLKLGGVMTVTGEVGAGKSTSMRWALSAHHPSELHAVEIVATTGAIAEFYRQLAWGLDIVPRAGSRVSLMNEAKEAIKDFATVKKQKVAVVVDEAQLLRREVMTELHTLLNFDHDSKNHMSLVLCGQSTVLESLQNRTAAALRSRVMTKATLRNLTPVEMEEYLNHHLRVAGVKRPLFEPAAVTAIHQGSAGVLRHANHLASGGLVAAAIEKKDTVTAEHIRIAASELI